MPIRPTRERRAEIVAAAFAYAVAGWPVFPVHTATGEGGCSCGRSRCPAAGKHPRTRHGLRDASTDLDRVAAWLSRWPDTNLAIRTGAVLVIDIDGTAGRAALAALQRAHGQLPPTRRARTARGEHLYFHAAGRVLGNSSGRLGPGIDVRGRGGYVVAPPSLHASGHHYVWSSRQAVAALPEWVHALAQPDYTRPPLGGPMAGVEPGRPARVDRYVAAAVAAETAAILAARPPTPDAPGTRNDTLNRAAFRLGQLAGADLVTPGELVDPLLTAALQVGLGEREARATITSGMGAGTRYPRRLRN